MSTADATAAPVLREFAERELPAALEHAAAGGQALHLHARIADWARAPAIFKRAVRRGEPIAHLFDRDRDRLVRTAQALGVRVVLVERGGTAKQHVDLCAGPLARARGRAVPRAEA